MCISFLTGNGWEWNTQKIISWQHEESNNNVYTTLLRLNSSVKQAEI